MAPLLSGGTTVYMKTVPTLDKWGTAYTYVGTASTYTMTSTGNGTAITFTDGRMTSS